MKENGTTSISLLREKSIWVDVKGRTMLIFQRWHQGGGSDYRCVDVDIVMIETMTIITRPYLELVELIRIGKMKYKGELTPAIKS